MCNAHLLRELQAVTDHHHHATAQTPDAWCWAQQVSQALLTLHKAAAAQPDTPVDPGITAETTKIRPALLAATPQPAPSAVSTEPWHVASTGGKPAIGIRDGWRR